MTKYRMRVFTIPYIAVDENGTARTYEDGTPILYSYPTAEILPELNDVDEIVPYESWEVIDGLHYAHTLPEGDYDD